KPVTMLSGRRSRGSAMLRLRRTALPLESGDEGGIERIEAAADETRCNRPERPQAVDDLHAAGAARQQKRRALPVIELEAVVAQHRVRETDAFEPLAASHRGLARTVRPVLAGTENAAQTAHACLAAACGPRQGRAPPPPPRP